MSQQGRVKARLLFRAKEGRDDTTRTPTCASPRFYTVWASHHGGDITHAMLSMEADTAAQAEVKARKMLGRAWIVYHSEVFRPCYRVPYGSPHERLPL